MKKKVSIFWFRRDLRLDDNAGLFKALASNHPVLPIFIFDREILKELPEDDARLTFIHQQVQNLNKTLQKDYNSGIAMYSGTPLDVFKELTSHWDVTEVYTNRDYEPYARQRDTAIEEYLLSEDISFKTSKDHVIFEKNEITKDDGNPYVVYTPYKNKWKEIYKTSDVPLSLPSETRLNNLLQFGDFPALTLGELGFRASDISVPDYNLESELVRNYEKTRNYPAADGTSHLGPHLRFGTISVRRALKKAMESENETFWNELIWREFFMQILWHFPHTTTAAFKKQYDRIAWRNREDEFEKWKKGETGFALVDAGMRQLNKTGYMHNRVRMLVASFLCKHLLIDWRWGEAYFAEKLLDYECSSNVGNWQWAAGSGVDAAPYFRIFNPMTQVDKFDKDHSYIKTWIPEFGSPDYVEKMVDHKQARERCLQTYKEALN
ncbi:cryptochrome/photolyase family protein [Robiginitalea aurantiaca]|uniref:Deoxyribodipyrimidine photo-lyase n=1 Tax=Robiginitalea aurantiaca TaxID=3056915 RepID=A0ABT7WGZ5_9FLAO|nr:deoxyribodipyrimidine photo-lyase [Robiginitalea aurantiaca]MDM9632193.1 deoxyribodipyrimidine photo-lyase [Robiginitalea aurantiaca]